MYLIFPDCDAFCFCWAVAKKLVAARPLKKPKIDHCACHSNYSGSLKQVAHTCK